jgi:hypothetical protein
MIDSNMVSKLRQKFAIEANYQYFFDKLTSPDWIIPLSQGGFFKTPPHAIAQDDGSILFPVWVESRYLVKMAAVDPVNVALVLDKIEATDNQRVLEDQIAIMLELPPKIAARYSKKVVNWLATNYQIRLPDLAAELILKLASAGYWNQAYELTETLFEVLPPDRPERLAPEDMKYGLLDPKIKYRDFEYQQLVEKVTPALIKANPIKAVEVFGTLLELAVKYKLSSYDPDGTEDESAIEDYSAIWRPSIDETMQHWDEQPRQSLLSAFRDSLTAIINGSLSDEEKLGIIKQTVTRRYKVFKRIAEYVLRTVKANKMYEPVYAALISDEEPILDQTLLMSGVQEFTPSSPLTFDELRRLTDDELLAMLREFVPSEYRFERDTTATVVEQVFGSDIKHYAKLGEQITLLPLQYANSFVTAAKSSIKDLDAETLKAVLETSYSIINLKEPKDEQSEQYHNWAKMAIARFINELSTSERSQRLLDELGNLEIASKCLVLLARDPDPSKADEERYKNENSDALTLSLNSIRGQAMYAICAIAWVASKSSSKELAMRLFTEIEWHLSETNDSSGAVRAAIGRWLPWLNEADNDWLQKHISAILSDDALGQDAWVGYIFSNSAYDQMLKIVQPTMKICLIAAQAPSKIEGNRDSNIGLSQHIMAYYYRGLIPLKAKSLVEDFFSTVAAIYRAEAIRFLGNALRNEKALPVEVRLRLEELWDYRLSEAEADKEGDRDELVQFGAWFASGKFDEAWSLSKLLETIKIAKTAEPDFLVLKRLDELALEYPRQCIEALTILVRGARERWAIGTWNDQAVEIIACAYSSSDHVAKKAASDLANELVARGYLNFRNVLESKPRIRTDKDGEISA